MILNVWEQGKTPTRLHLVSEIPLCTSLFCSSYLQKSSNAADEKLGNRALKKINLWT